MVVGAAMIAVAIWQPWSSPFMMSTGYAMMFGMGASLMLGGLSMMLAPTPPKFDYGSDAEDKPSYLFNGPTNVAEAGMTIPVIYGEVFTGSIPVSVGVTVTKF